MHLVDVFIQSYLNLFKLYILSVLAFPENQTIDSSMMYCLKCFAYVLYNWLTKEEYNKVINPKETITSVVEIMTSFKNYFMNNGFMHETHQLFYCPDKFVQTKLNMKTAYLHFFSNISHCFSLNLFLVPESVWSIPVSFCELSVNVQAAIYKILSGFKCL